MPHEAFQRTQVSDNLYHYLFPPEGGNAYGFSLYTLISGSDVLLIDTAYEEQAAQVLADLQAGGLSLRQVLISHFHDDHIAGLKVLPPVTVWGSEQYPASLDETLSAQEWQAFPPVHELSGSSVLEFGEFTLTFQPAPGHSSCSIYSIINGQVVHVGDNLMAANDGTPLLPWVLFAQVGQMVQSLQRLQALQPQLLLLSHGRPIAGPAAIQSEIDDRLVYLRAVMESGGEISFEEATAGCSRRFLAKEWHLPDLEP